MTLKTALFLLLFLPVSLIAQQNAEQPNFTKAKMLPGEAIGTFDLVERKEIKRVFFLDDWSEGNFFFFSNREGTQRVFPLKYDILNQQLNVNLAGSIYVVPLDSISGFLFEDKLLGTYRHEFLVIPSAGSKSAEIFEITVPGDYRLLTKHVAERQKANYQPALDAGSRDEKAIRKEYYYFLNKNGELIAIPKKKKSAQAMFSRIPKAKKYLAKNKVNFKNKKDLQKLFLYMNNN